MSLNQSNLQPEYQEFEPPMDWEHEEESSTLIVALPGFKKEQLRVQITSSGLLRLSGERKISENKFRKFYKELPLPPNTNASRISAKFESGILYVKLPKGITPIEQEPPTTPTPSQAPRPQQEQTKREAPIAQDQQKPKVVDKAAEPKTEKVEPPTPTPTTTPPVQKPTAPPKVQEDYSQKKEQIIKEKGKAQETDARKIAKDERAEATTSRRKEMHGIGKGDKAKMEKRSPTLELGARQSQEYKSAVYGLVEELKKQKKLANLVVVIFLVLVFVIYVKNAIKSSFGGTKSEEL